MDFWTFVLWVFLALIVIEVGLLFFKYVVLGILIGGDSIAGWFRRNGTLAKAYRELDNQDKEAGKGKYAVKEIFADFNNQEGGRVRLDCLGSKSDIAKLKPDLGEEVWLVQTEDTRCKGTIEWDGIYYGRPDWMTLEDWIDGQWVLAPEYVRRGIVEDRA